MEVLNRILLTLLVTVGVILLFSESIEKDFDLVNFIWVKALAIVMLLSAYYYNEYRKRKK